jgi:hypothetical protein
MFAGQINISGRIACSFARKVIPCAGTNALCGVAFGKEAMKRRKAMKRKEESLGLKVGRVHEATKCTGWGMEDVETHLQQLLAAHSPFFCSLHICLASIV